jgi:hypothetical protein
VSGKNELVLAAGLFDELVTDCVEIHNQIVQKGLLAHHEERRAAPRLNGHGRERRRRRPG